MKLKFYSLSMFHALVSHLLPPDLVFILLHNAQCKSG